MPRPLGLFPYSHAELLEQLDSSVSKQASRERCKPRSLRSAEPGVQLTWTVHAGLAGRLHQDQCRRSLHAFAMCAAGTCFQGSPGALCLRLKTFGQLVLLPEHAQPCHDTSFDVRTTVFQAWSTLGQNTCAAALYNEQGAMKGRVGQATVSRQFCTGYELNQYCHKPPGCGSPDGQQPNAPARVYKMFPEG